MTRLLDEAISRIREMPDSDQDEAARTLLRIISRKTEPVPLDEETRRAVREGLEQARRAEFASDEEIAELFRRRGP
jgi:hypothetical protein